MRRTTSARRTPSALIAAPLVAVAALALAACGVDRSGTLSGDITTTLNSCSGAAGSTEVTWSGVNAASIRVTYRRGSTNKNSPWTAASGEGAGTAVVAIPASAATAEWSVYKVEYATGASGGGTRTSRPIDCATAVTTTSAPVSTKPPETLPPESIPTETIEPPITEAPSTTVATCANPPVNSAAPTISRTGDGRVTVDEGTWDAGPNCSFTGWAHDWERSYNGGPWAGFSGRQDWWQPAACWYRYRVTVTKSNEVGEASATSAIVQGC